ncbi:hypothetical protein, partial [Ruminococcus champanellensis]|uniref:hypothetical protein n=1 Tax=Ruminococcus champanellensis TaxID=1161942 RepID=UPI0023F3B2F1
FFFLIPVIILNFTSFRIVFYKGPFLRKKSRSRPVEFKDLLMGTPQTMRRPSSVSAKGTLRKSAVLTVKQLSPQIGEITGVKRNCFPKNLQVLCRSPRMSFFYPCPGISPQRRQAHIFAQSYPIRTVIQFLICPSIGSQREGPKINPLNNQLGTFSPFARKNFCKLFVNGSFNDKKSRYTAHQISGR